jgi:hypothetical protein
VQNAVLQLEDDVRLLAENLTQEQEARAGLELTASETEARFEADVKFAGNTAAISLIANDDGSSARLAGDSITLDGDTIITGSLTMDNTNDPNGEITNSAGDFRLDENGLNLDDLTGFDYTGDAKGGSVIDWTDNNNTYSRIYGYENNGNGILALRGKDRVTMYDKNGVGRIDLGFNEINLETEEIFISANKKVFFGSYSGLNSFNKKFIFDQKRNVLKFGSSMRRFSTFNGSVRDEISKGEALLYTHEDSNGNLDLRVALRNNQDQVKDTSIKLV